MGEERGYCRVNEDYYLDGDVFYDGYKYCHQDVDQVDYRYQYSNCLGH
jgi:hypothetical protein